MARKAPAACRAGRAVACLARTTQGLVMPPVVILAGSRPGAPDPVATAEGVPHKVLARVEGQTLLERVVRAASDYGASEIAVAANHPAVEDEARRLGATVLPTARGPSESVALAFERYGAPLLVTTADHGLLEPGWLSALVAGTPPGPMSRSCWPAATRSRRRRPAPGAPGWRWPTAAGRAATCSTWPRPPPPPPLPPGGGSKPTASGHGSSLPGSAGGPCGISCAVA